MMSSCGLALQGQSMMSLGGRPLQGQSMMSLGGARAICAGEGGAAVAGGEDAARAPSEWSSACKGALRKSSSERQASLLQVGRLSVIRVVIQLQPLSQSVQGCLYWSFCMRYSGVGVNVSKGSVGTSRAQAASLLKQSTYIMCAGTRSRTGSGAGGESRCRGDERTALCAREQATAPPQPLRLPLS